MARKGTRTKRRSGGRRRFGRRSSRKGSVLTALLPRLGIVALGVAGGVAAEMIFAPKTTLGRAVVCGVGSAFTAAAISMPFASTRKGSALVPTMLIAGTAGALYGARGWLQEQVGKLTKRIRSGKWSDTEAKLASYVDTTAEVRDPVEITGAVPTSDFSKLGAGFGSGAGVGVQQQLPQPGGSTYITYEAPEDKSTSLERILLGIADAAADFGGAVLGGSKGGRRRMSEADALALAVA